ncbi:hypothetical protein AB395_00006063 (plasmid) [Sinorhizobium fredii CCBAU 45436]|nr:hypothetical protein AB395_00006063 [Sinorhizobium fredii CCBAU 45436]
MFRPVGAGLLHGHVNEGVASGPTNQFILISAAMQNVVSSTTG